MQSLLYEDHTIPLSIKYTNLNHLYVWGQSYDWIDFHDLYQLWTNCPQIDE